MVAPRLRKEVFLMAIALSIEIGLRAEGPLPRILLSGILSPLVSLNIHCPINIQRSLQNSNMAMVLENRIVLKINMVEVQM